MQAKIEAIITDNAQKIIGIDSENICSIKLADIRQQNLHSSRPGALCSIIYKDSHDQEKLKNVWVKKVEEPKKFYKTLKNTFNLLSEANLQRQVTKPYWYDEELGLIFIGNVIGSSLLVNTAKNTVFLPIGVSYRFHTLYGKIGTWLKKYHETMVSDQMLVMGDLLSSLENSLRSDTYLKLAEKKIISAQLEHINQDAKLSDIVFKLIRPHNDFTLRNILIFDSDFTVVDWDAMIHPQFSRLVPGLAEVSTFLTNLHGLLRFWPLISQRKIVELQNSFMTNYWNHNENVPPVEYGSIPFERVLFLFALRQFLGVGSDRTLPQIQNNRLGKTFVNLVKKKLLQGRAGFR